MLIAASTVLEEIISTRSLACWRVISGPLMPSMTGLQYFNDRSMKLLATLLAISSSCLVSPLIMAPSVITASTSLRFNNSLMIRGIS